MTLLLQAMVYNALPEFMEKCGEWSDANSCRYTKTDFVSPNVL